MGADNRPEWIQLLGPTLTELSYQLHRLSRRFNQYLLIEARGARWIPSDIQRLNITIERIRSDVPASGSPGWLNPVRDQMGLINAIREETTRLASCSNRFASITRQLERLLSEGESPLGVTDLAQESATGYETWDTKAARVSELQEEIQTNLANIGRQLAALAALLERLH